LENSKKRISCNYLEKKNFSKDKEYWDNWYKQFKVIDPSPFAIFCESNYFSKNSQIIDVGCGNGRDSLFFLNKGYDVQSIDSANSHCSIPTFINCDACNFKYDTDIVYCRWLLHALDTEGQSAFLQSVANDIKKKGLLCIECRSIKDKINPKIQNHFRNPIDRDILEKDIKKLGFEICFSGEQNGWSKIGDDDPLLIRIIAKK